MKPIPKVKPLESFEVYQPGSTRSNDGGFSGEALSRNARVVSWVCRGLAAGIMMETLYFKFTGHPESIDIFSRMHMESWGRYGQGIWELMASVLLFIPPLTWLGAFLTLAAMGAAILSHLTVLGIQIRGDHGLLFGMACLTCLAGLITLWIHQRSIPNIVRLDDLPE